MKTTEQAPTQETMPGYYDGFQRVYCVECTPLMVPSTWTPYVGRTVSRCSGCGQGVRS